MPGLNQLKKFSEDMQTVGDETKIRAQRGEKTSSVPLPENISEKDDSEDFLIGMPEIKKDEPENEDAASKVDTSATVDVPDIDSILAGEKGDEAPDLSEFMDDVKPDAQNPDDSENQNDENASASNDDAIPETPLEDLDLDDLLNSIPDDGGNPDENQNSEKIDSAEPVQNSGGEDSIHIENGNDEVEDVVPEAVSDVLPDTKENNPDSEFDFDGNSINLNADVPDDILAKDGNSNPDDEKTDSQPDLQNDSQIDSQNAQTENPDVENPDNSDKNDASSLPEMDNDMSMFDTSGLDGIDFGSPSGNIAGSENASPEDSASKPDASLDVPGDDSFTSETDSSNAPKEGEEVSPEIFDTSEMENVDFTPKAPESSSSGISDNEFPVTGENQNQNDDFVLDDSFTIPGFSDTETADLSKKPQVDTVDFSGKAAKPKNTLTEQEYEQFKKNLTEYPLNLRLAIEDFIAKNEFTDDAVFEIIEKVLKKAPARQVASQLEKMLDITINVPRDYEKRSYEQYEAYKQSFQYTLRNRIIPAAVVGVVLCFVCFGLFKAAQRFIYEPVMATINYKQGYALLENNEFPQSEDKFSVAVSHKPIKKWFFKFADGYREKKQYERAANIYRNALSIFNHDLQAGIAYAEMELYDRANYEHAEEIVRRDILDYHINNPDGLLLLGDVFLEWGETDSSKYELAKNQYIDLLQRYGQDNLLYLSRMLRYYIRTDKLREVLNLKNVFYQKKNIKSLGADDWTELSGYLLDKEYGTLAPDEKYLRSSIEDVRPMLELAVSLNPKNPVARYNLARYYVHSNKKDQAKTEFENALSLFDAAKIRAKKDVYRQINASRILGELHAESGEYLKAREAYTRGVDLYNDEHDSTGFDGDENTGKLFADLGDIDYFISGDFDSALYNYQKSAEIKNDTPSVNYRIGAIYYGKEDYDNALPAFLKVFEKEPKDTNMLLALGNTLVFRNDNFAAQSYYEDLLSRLDLEKAKKRILQPQEDADDGAVVDLYLKASNNLGVALYRTAQQTGDSQKNAQAMVKFSDSMRAWDALTRNPETMVRMQGSNLAEQNSKYITHSFPDFEPEIYTEIPKVMEDEKELSAK